MNLAGVVAIFLFKIRHGGDGDEDVDSGGDGHIDDEESARIGLSVNKSCDIFRCDTFQERDVVCVSQTQIINCALRA